MKPELRSELLRRAGNDQAARGELEPGAETLASVDAENLAWLRGLVAEVGWPGRSMVGEDGARARPGCWRSTPTRIRRSSASAWT
jgi:hypothetical protein